MPAPGVGLLVFVHRLDDERPQLVRQGNGRFSIDPRAVPPDGSAEAVKRLLERRPESTVGQRLTGCKEQGVNVDDGRRTVE